MAITARIDDLHLAVVCTAKDWVAELRAQRRRGFCVSGRIEAT